MQVVYSDGCGVVNTVLLLLGQKKIVKMVNREELLRAIKRKLNSLQKALDAFHIRKADELIQDNQWITQREIAIKLGLFTGTCELHY